MPVIVVPETDFEWMSGEELRQSFAKPSGWHTTFCRRCGSPQFEAGVPAPAGRT